MTFAVVWALNIKLQKQRHPVLPCLPQRVQCSVFTQRDAFCQSSRRSFPVLLRRSIIKGSFKSANRTLCWPGDVLAVVIRRTGHSVQLYPARLENKSDSSSIFKCQGSLTCTTRITGAQGHSPCHHPRTRHSERFYPARLDDGVQHDSENTTQSAYIPLDGKIKYSVIARIDSSLVIFRPTKSTA